MVVEKRAATPDVGDEDGENEKEGRKLGGVVGE